MNVTIITDSINEAGNRMTTMEIEYPRFILAELNTHRMLSKNSASSRAIPVAKMHEQILANPAMPVHWGQNQAGMQAKSELKGYKLSLVKLVWALSRQSNVVYAKLLGKLGLHKQLANRRTEPDMMMKTVISGTEWANFFHLRDHPDAQPELQALARLMHLKYNSSEPQLLRPGEWHLPYIDCIRNARTDELNYYLDTQLTLEEARVVSASCCAQVSYRNSDSNLAKAKKIFSQLIESTPCHASPVEHQATPMSSSQWQKGVTHIDANSNQWSGNLKGFIQFRKLIPNEAVW